MACALAPLTQCPNLLKQLFIYSLHRSALRLALYAPHGGPQEGAGGEPGEEGGRDNSDLALNSDFEK